MTKRNDEAAQAGPGASETGGKERGMENTEQKELEAAAEGILFASGEPVRIDRICLALSLEQDQAERILQGLADYYAYERRGIRLLHLEDSWQLCSSPDCADAIRRAFEIRKPAKLSQPALEALTIIAYYQPATRAFVEKLRGVDSGYTVSLLLDRKLIEPCGRLQVPGRPRLYRTTRQFLTAFHLTSLDDLPPLPENGLEGQMRLNEDGSLADEIAAGGGVQESGTAPGGTVSDGTALDGTASNGTAPDGTASPETPGPGEAEELESVVELPENAEDVEPPEAETVPTGNPEVNPEPEDIPPEPPEAENVPTGNPEPNPEPEDIPPETPEPEDIPPESPEPMEPPPEPPEAETAPTEGG